MAYLDNIIIYLSNKLEHKEHIKWVLRRLYKENILVIIKKCEFYTKKTNFTKFIIKLEQISIYLKKINNILKEYLDDFVIAYLNNIITYLNNKKEYKEYIKQVLKKLYNEDMLVIIKKCKFYTKKTDFIGFIIKLKQISINLKKIKVIINQQDLKSIIGLKLFLGFSNYYKKFIIKWLNKIKLFTKIIRKDKIQK